MKEGISETELETTESRPGSKAETVARILPELGLTDDREGGAECARSTRPFRRSYLVFGWLVLISAMVFAGVRTAKLVKNARPRVIELQRSTGRLAHIPETKRRRVFRRLVSSFPRHWKRARGRFPGKPWSISDDFHYQERVEVTRAASRHRLSKPEIYLILDEGIRRAWPGPNGEPLPSNPPALRPRNR